MPLNKVKGNMYEWITHTINFIKGICPHNCSYCYARHLNCYPPKLDEKEFKVKLQQQIIAKNTEYDLFGNNKESFTKTIEAIKLFIGSSIDNFAKSIPIEWITRIAEHIKQWPENQYILQTKNPEKMIGLKKYFPHNCLYGVTIETDNYHFNFFKDPKLPSPEERVAACEGRNEIDFITIEPIMPFNLNRMLKIANLIKPRFINIGAYTGEQAFKNPESEAIKTLILEFRKCGFEVRVKDNLNKIIGGKK